MATTALEVAKRKVADVGEAMDPAAATMIKKGYSDDGVAGGTKQDVARMMGEHYNVENNEFMYEVPSLKSSGKGASRSSTW